MRQDASPALSTFAHVYAPYALVLRIRSMRSMCLFLSAVYTRDYAPRVHKFAVEGSYVHANEVR